MVGLAAGFTSFTSFGYFFRVRMYFTRSLIWSLLSFSPYLGILSLPLVMMPLSSSSDCFWTSADPKSRKFIFLPMAVSPAPVAPWHIAHFDLKVSAPVSAANDDVQNSRANP